MKYLRVAPVTFLAALGLLISSIPAASQDAPAADKTAPAADQTTAPADATVPAADKTASTTDDDAAPPVATNLTPEQQKALDKQAAAKEKKDTAKEATQAKNIDDPVIAEYVNRIGQNLVRNSDAKVPFTIKVVDSEEINAFALPGGFFFVNSGILLNADNEAEMAGVMAHEIAHVAARHGTRQASRGELAQIMTIPLWMMGGWTGYAIRQGMSIAIPMGFLQFTKGFEKEADYLGLQYMYKAGYDPTAFVDFFEKIQTLEKKKPGTMAKVFSSHPPTDDRIKAAQEEIQTILKAKPEYVLDTSEFQNVKHRLEMLHGRRTVGPTEDPSKPRLRRATGNTDGSPDANSTDSTTTDSDRPTLKRRDPDQ